ncbi:unnamed protein product [Cuscuta campestris]|uniref:CCHC-type domain-containing protein n=1 Tax=Cuscuta campestris TaxID=132261 RepID=A0A484KXD3_9ASTE|nr:unnamed protein product [Cuscuta campestris]
MHFLLTTLKVVYVLSTPMPEIMDDKTLEQTRKRCKWENDDYICRGHILNGMSDSLFDVYQNVESAKLLWDGLEETYMAEDALSKKFLVSNFNNYKMINSRRVMEQYNELLRILGLFAHHNMAMDESISMSSIIDKLPPSWKECKRELKHNKEEMDLVQLGTHLRIEESIRDQEGKKVKDIVDPSSINIVENEDFTKVQNKSKGKKRKSGNTPKPVNKKAKMGCWKCGKPDYFKQDCQIGKRDKQDTSKNGSGQGTKDQNKSEGQIC